MSRPPPSPWHRRLATLVPDWVRRALLRFEAALEDAVLAFSRELPAGTVMLDAGAGQCQHAPLFAHCRYVGVDLGVGDAQWDYSQLDAVSDLGALPFRDSTFHAALSVVVLEHVQEPASVVREIGRVVAPGSPFLLVVPQEWERHQEPYDYFRFTSHGVRLLLERGGFQVERIAPTGGLYTLVGRKLLYATLALQGGWRWLLFPLAVVILLPLGLLLPLLDGLDRHKVHTLGYVVRARRAADLGR